MLLKAFRNEGFYAYHMSHDLFLFQLIQPVSLDSSLDFIFIISSSIAEKLANPQSKLEVMVSPNILYRNGKQNSISPVALLAYVCMKDKALYFTNPIINEPMRITATAPIQHNIHKGR
ncbi:hypothetical protein PDUR_22610 [Paenibacillus durus]|uniref:Uncharacterized protein n=1 Tax=Paenibacillus durus TaxID=44251 RepID=A0A089HTJ9_PAEDU|nr:hypothetical protein PDUR_22610 [Paenibacillus durus]